MTSTGRTSLSRDEYERALTALPGIVAEHGKITNRILRTATGLNYDQAIRFFSRAVENGVVVRVGHGGGIHYLVPSNREAP